MTRYEMEKIETEFTNEKKYYSACGVDRDHYLFGKFVLLFAAVVAFNIPLFVEAIDCICPSCEAPLQIKAVMVEERRIFPDTWTCRQCGYENYEGLNYCGICGGAK